MKARRIYAKTIGAGYDDIHQRHTRHTHAYAVYRGAGQRGNKLQSAVEPRHKPEKHLACPPLQNRQRSKGKQNESEVDNESRERDGDNVGKNEIARETPEIIGYERRDTQLSRH